MYKVRDSSGVEYGPLDLETLELWAVQNRINANSIIIDQSTGETKLAKTIPELQAIFHVPAAFPQRAVQVPIGAHSPIIAVVLSILLSGLGQVYNRQILKGVVFFLVNLCLCCGGFIISMGLIFSTVSSSTSGGANMGFGSAIQMCTNAICFVIYVVNVIDAGMIAARLQRGEAITDWQMF
ncbi:MAG: hypothetical protein WCO51_04810 [bacterium]|jgi:hypothetical protein